MKSSLLCSLHHVNHDHEKEKDPDWLDLHDSVKEFVVAVYGLYQYMVKIFLFLSPQHDHHDQKKGILASAMDPYTWILLFYQVNLDL